MNPPAFVIHDPSCSERTEIVNELVKKTGAIIVAAVMLPNGKDGCRASHLAVARLARGLHPDKHYVVFEDDCELLEGWEDVLQTTDADVVYLGYTDRSKKVIYGTHAMRISPNLRNEILKDTEGLKDEVENRGAFDHILSKLLAINRFKVACPRFEDRERWAVQKKGIKSLITGKIR